MDHFAYTEVYKCLLWSHLNAKQRDNVVLVVFVNSLKDTIRFGEAERVYNGRVDRSNPRQGCLVACKAY